MAEKLIAVPEQKLTDIADAIRLKRDLAEPIPVEDMAMQIGLIEGGVNIPFASKFSCGTYIPDTDMESRLVLTHNLGAKPIFFIMYTNDIDIDSFGTKNYYKYFVFADDGVSNVDPYKKCITCVYDMSGTDTKVYRSYGNNIGIYTNNFTESDVTFKNYNGYAFKAGAKYNWIAIA